MDVIKPYSDNNSCYLTDCELIELMHDYVLNQRYGVSCSTIDYRLVAKHYLNLLADECFTYKFNTKEPAPPLPIFEAEFISYICQRIELDVVTDYTAQFSDFVCERFESLTFEVKAQYSDYVCEKKELIDINKAYFEAYFDSYVCQRRSVDVIGYTSEYSDFICEVIDYTPTYEVEFSDYLCEVEEIIPSVDNTIFAFDVDNSSIGDFAQFLMSFQSINGIYSVKPDTTMDEQQQTVAMQTNDYLRYRYEEDGLNNSLIVEYEITGTHNVKIKYTNAEGNNNTLQEARDVCFQILMHDLDVVNDIDISLFTNLTTFEIINGVVDSLTLPAQFSNTLGLTKFELNSLRNLLEVDFSNTVIPQPLEDKTPASTIKIISCTDVTDITLPECRQILEIRDNIALKSIDFTGVSFDVQGLSIVDNEELVDVLHVPVTDFAMRLFRFDNNPQVIPSQLLGKFSNLTNISGLSALTPNIYSMINNNYSAAQINAILAYLDSISLEGFNYRRILLTGNAAPDTTSGSHNGVVAKNNLIRKGFAVITA